MFESTMVPTLLYDARSGLPLEVLSTSNIYVSAKVRRIFRKSKYFNEKTLFKWFGGGGEGEMTWWRGGLWNGLEGRLGAVERDAVVIRLSLVL